MNCSEERKVRLANNICSSCNNKSIAYVTGIYTDRYYFRNSLGIECKENKYIVDGNDKYIVGFNNIIFVKQRIILDIDEFGINIYEYSRYAIKYMTTLSRSCYKNNTSLEMALMLYMAKEMGL